MSHHSAESINFKVVNLNNPDREEQRDFRMLTLDKVFAWIDKKEYDESIKNELKKMVSKYPSNAYSSFGKNFRQHLGKAQMLAKKDRPLFVGELGDDNYKKLDSLNDDFKSPDFKKSSVVTDTLTKEPKINDYINMQTEDFDNGIDLKSEDQNPLIAPNGLKEI
ncbi:MAG: hypothetical protein WCJ72_01700 [Chryseobacterium sp.]